ncbi:MULTISPECIES: aldo/keto reductase [unclassified Pseudofrankia]|uniref:aldo/keto reductase n=1 Tax=unclassified Pseudofrankia TaxID=2994372 RepID=UPI0008DA8F01|nr:MULTISPECIES: aldo/keto reductase [unclassified Pseudofrankia]MDT3446562.1 aldo/keto reductase [Pseudofrankia sp. BMG5.37]OHV59930.1 hypothetical protein BCD48_40965 [Pseudofrankia sp. BMG5.36]
MDFTRLGTTGLRLSRIVLGGATFGELADQAEVREIVARALDLGIVAFDTASVYGNGDSERFLGAALGSRRDDVVLMTKVGLRAGDDELANLDLVSGRAAFSERWSRGIPPNSHGLSRINIIRSVEESLRRLGTDHIDVLALHYWDQSTPIEETLRATDDLVTAGKVRYVGSSLFQSWQLYSALWTADRMGLHTIVSQQAPLNALSRGPEKELLPACAAAGVGVLAFQAMAGGMLTGRFHQAEAPDPGSRFAHRKLLQDQYWNDETFACVRAVEKIAADHGTTTSAVAVAWVLSRPAVSATILGVDRAEQVAGLVGAVATDVDMPSAVAAVDDLTPPQIKAPY